VKNLLLASAFALAACDLTTASDEYRAGVPKADAVTMNVPQGTGGALTSSTGVQRQGLEGDTAQFYKMTRDVSVFVNGAGLGILNLVQDIAAYPATQIEDGKATWGPWTDSLSPNTYRFTVTKNKESDFSYVLEGKGKNQDDSAFLVLLSGSHVVSTSGKAFGHGTFLLDLDKIGQLPEHDANSQGTVQYVYSHESADVDTDVQAQFTQVWAKDSNAAVNAEYHYISNDKTGGSLDFQFQGNID
jgi:hypothetical protein